MSNYTYADGAIHNDHHKEMTINVSGKTDIAALMKAFMADDAEEVEEIKSEKKEEVPLRNHIFQHRIFNTNERLKMLRNIIASAIDMGDDTSLYGKPQEIRINPNANNEWYYILKAIKETGVAKDFSSTDFLDQMREWFPSLFSCASPEVWEESKRRLSKSISAEKKLWKHGAMQEEIPLKDMWAKQKTLAMDSAKMERIYAIAYQGLYQNLMNLKQEIAEEKSR